MPSRVFVSSCFPFFFCVALWFMCVLIANQEQLALLPWFPDHALLVLKQRAQTVCAHGRDSWNLCGLRYAIHRDERRQKKARCLLPSFAFFL